MRTIKTTTRYAKDRKRMIKQDKPMHIIKFKKNE